MPRLSIEISAEEHRKLKAVAALRGQSIKDYVLEKTLAEPEDDWTQDELAAVEELERLLAPRIADAEQGRISTLTFNEFIEEVKRKPRG